MAKPYKYLGPKQQAIWAEWRAEVLADYAKRERYDKITLWFNSIHPDLDLEVTRDAARDLRAWVEAEAYRAPLLPGVEWLEGWVKDKDDQNARVKRRAEARDQDMRDALTAWGNVPQHERLLMCAVLEHDRIGRARLVKLQITHNAIDDLAVEVPGEREALAVYDLEIEGGKVRATIRPEVVPDLLLVSAPRHEAGGVYTVELQGYPWSNFKDVTHKGLSWPELFKLIKGLQ